VQPSPDVAELVVELTRFNEMVNSGDSGLPAVERAVELTRRFTGAIGASYVEYGAAGGRVVATSGMSEFARGRHVDPAEPVTAALLRQGRLVEIPVRELPQALAEQLHVHGAARMLASLVELGEHLVGSLHAYFPDPDGEVTAQQRALVSFFASLLGHLYGDNRGLPVYADAPSASTLADAAAVVDRDGTVLSFNSAAARVLGEPVAAVVGRELPVPLPSTGQIIDHQLADGRWVQLLGTDLPGTTARIVTLRDTTEAHRKEQARDLFVTVTSHELRTPVTVIKGYADTLVNHWDVLDEQARRDAASRLGQRAGELARLVERLLTAVGDGSVLAQHSVGVPFDLADALLLGVDELPAEQRRRTRVRLPGELPKALGDRASIATVLSELVTNAAKYSPPEAPIELVGFADPGTVGFTVADRGIGVRSEHVERAFERFWQAESGDQRRYGGVGLGLYLVRRMVERQNGWVSLRPRDQGGTVAEVRLPRADAGPGEA
jgi:two-component system, OmpR family, phosphate regulon sensor histidine kinase PhoR